MADVDVKDPPDAAVGGVFEGGHSWVRTSDICFVSLVVIYGPFALVMDPGMFARLACLMQQGRRELNLVEKLVTAGIFQSTQMPADTVLVTSPQPWNYDLVVGQDVVTAYVGNEGLDHRFQIFETLALRIKRAGSVCVLH